MPDPIPTDVSIKSFEQIFNEEKGVIDERRKIAFHLPSAEAAKADPDPDLIGLALSGGGIRSAMFNLGILRAFQRSGLMRYVDYLSALSGGSYIAAYYSTVVSRVGQEKQTKQKQGESKSKRQQTVNWHDEWEERGREAERNSLRDQSESSRNLRPIDGEDQSFVFNGKYLLHPWRAGSIWLYGAFTSLISWISLMALCGLLVAMIYRIFDFESVRDHLSLIGFRSELSRAFVPTIILLVYWVTLVSIRVFWQGGRSHQESWLGKSIVVAFVLTALSIFTALAVLVGNENIALLTLGANPQPYDSTWQTTLQRPGAVTIGSIIIGAVGFVRQLLRSEKPSASLMQKWTFTIVLWLATGGAVVFVVGLAAKENISGHNEQRPPDIGYSEVRDKLAFCDLAEKAYLDATAIKSTRQAIEALTEANEALPNHPKNWRSIWNNFEMIRLEISHFFVTWCGRTDNINPVHVRWQKHAEMKRRFDILLKSFNQEMQKSWLVLRIAKLVDEKASWMSTESNFQESGLQSRWNRLLADSRFSPISRTKILQAIDQNAIRRPIWRSGSLEDYTELERRELCRALLELLDPGTIKSFSSVSTGVVVDKDQMARVWYLCAFAGALLVCLCLNVNRLNALAGFYRRQLRQVFLEPAVGVGLTEADRRRGEPLLHDLQPHNYGGPYPLIVAGMYVLGRQQSEQKKRRSTLEFDRSLGDHWYSWIFSPLYMGWYKNPRLTPDRSPSPGQYITSKPFDSEKGLPLSKAIGISGAALSPYMTDDLRLSSLMSAFGLNLGQWFHLPKVGSSGLHRCVCGGRWLIERFLSWWNPEKYWKNPTICHLADGGFREFFGAEELLLRRCSLVIISDAGCNNDLYEFGALADFVRQIRFEHGIEILNLDHDRPLDTDRLRRTVDANGQRQTPQHFILGRIKYPKVDDKQPPKMGLLVYIQMSMSGDESMELKQYHSVNKQFPDEPVVNQFYEPFDVHAFIELGEHIGSEVGFHLQPFEPGKPHHGSAEMRLEMISRSIIRAYQDRCMSEKVVATDDVGGSALWPLTVGQAQGDAIGVVNPSKFLQELRETENSLQEYERNPSFRLRLERMVALFPRMPIGLDAGRWIEDLRTEFPEADVPNGLLAPLVIEIHRQIRGFDLKHAPSFFQIGGRRELIKVCARLTTARKMHLLDPTSQDKWLVSFVRVCYEGLFREYQACTAKDVARLVAALFASHHVDQARLVRDIVVELKLADQIVAETKLPRTPPNLGLGVEDLAIR